MIIKVRPHTAKPDMWVLEDQYSAHIQNLPTSKMRPHVMDKLQAISRANPETEPVAFFSAGWFDGSWFIGHSVDPQPW